MSFAGETFEKRKDLNIQFESLTNLFEQKISQVDPEIQDLVLRDYPEIVKLFLEVKNSLTNRLFEAWKKGRKEFMPQALAEVNELLDVISDIINCGLEDYEISNIADAESGELISSHFKKTNKDSNDKLLETYSAHFNFVPTKKSEARFKISHYDHSLPQELAEKSFHIDRDERLGGVYVDINTPALEKVLKGIQGNEDGYGHHFKSQTLVDFVETAKFSSLVEAFQHIIVAQEEVSDDEISPDMLEKLKDHFNK